MSHSNYNMAGEVPYRVDAVRERRDVAAVECGIRCRIDHLESLSPAATTVPVEGVDSEAMLLPIAEVHVHREGRIGVPSRGDFPTSREASKRLWRGGRCSPCVR